MLGIAIAMYQRVQWEGIGVFCGSHGFPGDVIRFNCILICFVAIVCELSINFARRLVFQQFLYLPSEWGDDSPIVFPPTFLCQGPKAQVLPIFLWFIHHNPLQSGTATSSAEGFKNPLKLVPDSCVFFFFEAVQQGWKHDHQSTCLFYECVPLTSW